MKLGLIGRSISHSLSPQLYHRIIGPHVHYDLIDVSDESKLPSLQELSQKYDGINITAPYKQSYFQEVTLRDPVLKKIGAINTLSFTPEGILGTNTDLEAVRLILWEMSKEFPNLHLIILGDGVMAKLTLIVAQEYKMSYVQLARSQGLNLSNLDLNPYAKANSQTIVINSCAREFVFEGKLPLDSIFWDYNYNFLSHQKTLPSLVKSYRDGQEMLILQAEAAWDFWKATNPKLKC